MLISLFLLAACVDPNTPSGMRQIDNGAVPCKPVADLKKWSPPKARPARPVLPAEQKRVRDYVDETFYDGPATRFQFLDVRAGSLVCGKLNGKNRMGAYTGWRYFIYNLESGMLTVSQDEDDKVRIAELICAKPA